MKLLPFFQFFFDFATNSWLDDLYVVLVGFLVLGFILSLFGRKRYVRV